MDLPIQQFLTFAVNWLLDLQAIKPVLVPLVRKKLESLHSAKYDRLQASL